jgi:hypothetical protein
MSSPQSAHSQFASAEPAVNGNAGTGTVRDQRGRFGKGNPGGPGNPFNRKVAALRAALLAAATAQDVLDVLAAMLEKAKKGSESAAKLYLAYTVGKPADTVNPDHMDADEWQLRQKNAVQPGEIHRTFEMPVQLANTIADAAAPAIVQSMARQMLGALRPPVAAAPKRDQVPAAAAPSSNGANGGLAPSANGANSKPAPSASGTPSRNGANGGPTPSANGADEKPAPSASGSNAGQTPSSNGSNGSPRPSGNRANGPSNNGVNGGPEVGDLPDVLSLLAKMPEQAEPAARPAINRNPLQTIMARRP